MGETQNLRRCWSPTWSATAGSPVQRIDLLSALMLALLAHPAGEHEWMGEDALQMASPLILRMMSRVTRRPFKRPGLI
jgi:hypothetical protein